MMEFIEWDDLFDDNFDVLEIIDFGFPRRIQYSRTEDFYDLDELSFFRRYRLTKRTVLDFLPLIEEQIEYPSDINQCVTPINQLLTCLRFYASGSFLITISDIAKMHMSTVSRIVVRVSEAIARLIESNEEVPPPPENIPVEELEAFIEAGQMPEVLNNGDAINIERQDLIDNYFAHLL
ncbi:hypothetical protein RN001_012370 [Aquatica leii]|uniref:Nuclease HARBI1 n=1 Tax=Aquatica leii TaxID=1421715 RepID=A0AAN7P5D7_9COLE|nr:hypothetical protein RN001_012370 [Aquatica leii]